MNVSDYREIPYYFGINHCSTVFKNGRTVWRDESPCQNTSIENSP